MKRFRIAGIIATLALVASISACADREQPGIEPSETGLNEFIQALENKAARLYQPGGEIAPVFLFLGGDATLFHCGLNGQSEEQALQACRREQPIGQLQAPYTDSGTILCRMTAKPLLANLAQKSAICVSSKQFQAQSKIGKDAPVELTIPQGVPFYVLDVFDTTRPTDRSDVRFYFFSEKDAQTVKTSRIVPQDIASVPASAPEQFTTSVDEEVEEHDCEDMRAQLREAVARQQQAFGPELPAAIQSQLAIEIRMDTMGCSKSGGANVAASEAQSDGAHATAEDVQAAADAAEQATAAAEAAADAAEAAAASEIRSQATTDAGTNQAMSTHPVDEQEGAPTRSLDAQFRERANEDCPRGFLGKGCRQQIRDSLCAGKWSSDPKPGETECRR